MSPLGLFDTEIDANPRHRWFERGCASPESEDYRLLLWPLPPAYRDCSNAYHPRAMPDGTIRWWMAAFTTIKVCKVCSLDL